MTSYDGQSVWLKTDEIAAKTAIPLTANYRKKLLDGITRGNLINLSHRPNSRTHVRIVDADIDQAFETLTSNGGGGEFVPLDEPPEEPLDEQTERFLFAYETARRSDADYEELIESLDPDDENDQRTIVEAERRIKDQIRELLRLPPRLKRGVQSPAEIARSQGVDPSYELSVLQSGGTIRKPIALQTLQYAREMSAKVNALRTGSNRAMEETGSVALHAVFGFLEWKIADRDDRTYLSPLILTPIEFSSTHWSRSRQFVVYGQGDDPRVNAALQIQLLSQERVVLPDLEEDESPTKYLARVEKIIEKRNGWRIRRFLTIGLFESVFIDIWSDLDPDKWPDDTQPGTHKVVAALLAGSEERDKRDAGEYDIDSPEMVQKIAEPLLDADSSQLSAMVDVLDGKDLAIQGPPGTGKSQTIANIIAATMRSGKTVLFVAEKMAALDVVKSRLDAVGLGDFVLELHSTKVRRSGVYQSFEPRLELAKHLKAPSNYESRIKELRDVKQNLNKYVKEINSDLGGTGKTVHEAMWRLRILASEPLPSQYSTIALKDASQISSAQVSDSLSTLRTYQSEFTENEAEFGSYEDHPWRFVNRFLSPIEQDQLVQHIRESLRTCAELLEETEELSWTGLGNSGSKSLGELSQVGQLLSELPSEIAPSVSKELLVLIEDEISLNDLRSLIRINETVKQERSITLDCTPGASSPPGDSLENILKFMNATGSNTVGEISDRISEIEQRVDGLQRLSENSQVIISEMGLQMTLTGENLRLLDRVIAALDSVSPASLRFRTVSYVDDGVVENIQALMSESSDILNELHRLPNPMMWRSSLGEDQLEEYSAALRKGGLFSRFKKATRQAVKRWKESNQARSIPSRIEMAAQFETVLKAKRLDNRINSNGDIKAVVGRELDGFQTDFENLVKALRFSQTAQSLVGVDAHAARSLREYMINAEIPELERLKQLSQLNWNVARSNAELVQPKQTVDEAIAEGRELITDSSSVTQEIATLNLDQSVTRDQLDKALAAARRWASLEQELASKVELTEKVASAGVGEHDNERLQATLEFFILIQQYESSTWPGITRNILSENPESNLTKLRTQVTAFKKSVDLAKGSVSEVLALAAGKVETELFEKDFSSLNSIQSTLNSANENRSWLARWIRLNELRREAATPLTQNVLELYEKDAEEVDLASIWEQVYWRSAISDVYGSNLVLRNGHGVTLSAARDRLKTLDGEIAGLTRQFVAALLGVNKGPAGSSVGSTKTLTESGLIDRLSKQQRPRVTIRDFLGRAGTAAVSLKPCFMMSPASVARYLPRGKALFDVVLMDEASQIKAEEAIGSLARGHQGVVVGDTKQLPPTRFFQRVGLDDSDDEDDDAESVLDLALNRFPFRTLLWHYRSEHQDLIKFSNRHFYNDELVVFPSASDAAALDMGVHFTHLPSALYRSGASGRRGGLNPEQAKRVAEDAISAMESRPEWSLGVVAVNKAQADMIEDEVHLLMQRSPAARQYYNDRLGTLEPFFVKNLENVQGDERDHIIISTVYGPTEVGGLTRQAFGPIGGEFGHRRLNVLFSRAKKRIDVVSSMTSADIRPGENAKEGVKALKAYLEFAATGMLEGSDAEVRGEPDSDFEEFVGRALSLKGYEVHYQVGVAGFRIDLGIRHSKYPHGYISGIECDGAMYHSARSARDRDLLRQQQLERMGWDIYRIWSTDWFEDPDQELKKLLSHLESRVSHLESVVEEEPVADVTEEPIDDGSDQDSVRFEELDEVFIDQVHANPVVNYEPDSTDDNSNFVRPSAPRSGGEEELTPPNVDWTPFGSEFSKYQNSSNDIEDLVLAGHPDQENSSTLQAIIWAVIEIEGPVHQNIIVDRVRDVYGLSKLSGRPRYRVETLIREIVDTEDVNRVGMFYSISGQENWGLNRVPRVAGGRSIDQIPESELIAACEQKATQENISDAEQLLHRVANALGYERIGPTIRDRLGRITESCVSQLWVSKNEAAILKSDDPIVAENLLVRQGYDPSLEPSDRWGFFLEIFIPRYSKQVAINMLKPLINHMSKEAGSDSSIVKQMNIDLKQLERYVGG